MIRYFEVKGLDDEVEYFGFMDTITDKIVEFDGEQFFSDYGQFLQAIDDEMLLRRLSPLIDPKIRYG